MSDSVITLSDSEESLEPIEFPSLPKTQKKNRHERNNVELELDDFPPVNFDYEPLPSEHFDDERDALQTQCSTQTVRKVQKASKKNKATVTEEKLQREQEKALKAIAAKKLRDMKPGECLKFMEVTLDTGLRNLDLTRDITEALQNANIRHKISTQLVPNSITWKRETEESYIDQTNTVRTIKNTEQVESIIVIWDCEETVKKVADQTVLSSISSIKNLIPKCIVTLVIYGIESYFPPKTKGRKTSKKKDSSLKNSPEITWKQLEICLSEVQLLEKCSSRYINNPQELASMICQYSKSIAEVPFKKEQHKNWKDKLDWYVSGDNKDTVRVDKDGNGLKRLWEQQLQLFNASSLEVAQTISSLYPSPASLMEAYARCTETEGMNLLKDIPVSFPIDDPPINTEMCCV